MEIFKLDKAIENEKLDLEMAIVQLKEENEHLSQSLKKRKEIANQMNVSSMLKKELKTSSLQAAQMKQTMSSKNF